MISLWAHIKIANDSVLFICFIYSKNISKQKPSKGIGICTNKNGQCYHKIQIHQDTFAHSFDCNTVPHIDCCTRQPRHSIVWVLVALDMVRMYSSTCIVGCCKRLWLLSRVWPYISHHIVDKHLELLGKRLPPPYLQLYIKDFF